MNFKSYLKFSFINIYRNRKSLIKNILFTSLAFVIFIATMSITKSLNNFINNYILDSTLHRTVMLEYLDSSNIDKESLMNKIDNTASIIDAYEYQVPIGTRIKNTNDLFKTNKYKELSLKFGYENEMPNIIKGNLFDKNDTNVGIIPSKFYPDGSLGIEFQKENIEFLNGEDFIGKVINTEYEITDKNGNIKKYEYKFKVVGTYDSVETIDSSCDVYIPYNDLKKINDQYKQEFKNSGGELVNTIAILVDKSNNVNQVIDMFSSQNGVLVFKKANVGLLEITSKLVLYIGIFMSMIVFSIAIINASLIKLNAVRRRYSEFGVMKAFGYNNSNIKNLLIVESILITSTGFVFAYLISSTLLYISNIVIKTKLSIYMSSFNISLDIKSVYIAFIVMIGIAIISSLKSIKYVIEIQPIDAIKNK